MTPEVKTTWRRCDLETAASYGDAAPGETLALIGSTGHLEIAVNRGSAFELLGLTEKKSLEIFVTGAEPGAGGKG